MLIDGSKVRAAREKTGKKVTAVAASIEMSAPWLYALEAKTEPVEMKAHTAHALARVIGAKVGDLI